MVTQKPISARIDKKLLQELELEASLGNMTKNKILNRALAMYLDFLDTQRVCSMLSDLDERYAEREMFLARCFSSNHN